ncbi:carboxypeptidase regulatory-like domain-containing protein [Micromonospora sp. AMSO1212t]|uniref:carboxypeptidase-like regulatory domain-containing protein n=1 Tax=Micromonospora sp. AMSO1212t TaxID=2650565 RepID=UPI00124B1A81|nr:carboxypeptidase-like regulatory domain-containing protein [Micromonospora sp. AMSO1212t]KAB1904651.1 carboxypeptidase regulatory-like domain-containing protein [Micromonospora sp. AMSO1212t]
MSTHRRAWKQRAGVVVALVFGALLTVPAAPAFAANIITADNSVTIDAGRSGSVNVLVRLGADETSADIDVTGLPDGVTCGNCGPVDFGGQQTKAVSLSLSAAPNAPAANGSQARITVTGDGGRQLRVTVRAAAPPTPQQPQTVKTVSGKVVNAEGEPISGALVMLRDSAGKERRTNTSGNGNFSFSGSESNPIAPGRIDLGASTDGASPVARSINANAGQSVTGVRLSIQVKASASPSATPSASESAPPSEEPLDEEATDTPSAEAPAAQQPAANEDSGGFGSWLLILLGGLFVAVGVGTIVLLYMRRKNEGDDGDGDGPGGPTGPGGPGGAAAAGAIPAARGAYHGTDDQTRVVNGMGAGPSATKVGGPSISDAPTMLQRPVVDDVPPDPYGAPPGASYGVGGGQGGYGYGDDAPGQGGYGGAGGYGNAPSSGGGYGNGPSSGAGYGNPDYAAGAAAAGAAGYAAQGGYGNERFDEPTGRYTGDSNQYAPAADPYPTSTYQPEQDRGYDQAGSASYGRGPEQGDGYGAAGGYGAASGGYDSGATGGYDNGRQQGGYGEPTGAYGNAATGGYGDAPAYGGGRTAAGYGDAPTGGYDNPPAGGYGDAPAGGYDSGRQQGGYGDAPAGGYDKGAGGYGDAPAGGYDSGRQPGGYGDAPAGGYGNAAGGYDGGHQSGGYGQQGGGYGDGYGQDPQGGYGHQQGGYGQEPPQQRGGGYDNAYPNDPAQAGRARPDGQADRGGRRLDWLDD